MPYVLLVVRGGRYCTVKLLVYTVHYSVQSASLSHSDYRDSLQYSVFTNYKLKDSYFCISTSVQRKQKKADHLIFDFGTGFTPNALPDITLPFNLGLGPALRVNLSVDRQGPCPGIKPRPQRWKPESFSYWTTKLLLMHLIMIFSHELSWIHCLTYKQIKNLHLGFSNWGHGRVPDVQPGGL